MWNAGQFVTLLRLRATPIKSLRIIPHWPAGSGGGAGPNARE